MDCRARMAAIEPAAPHAQSLGRPSARRMSGRMSSVMQKTWPIGLRLSGSSRVSTYQQHFLVVKYELWLRYLQFTDKLCCYALLVLKDKQQDHKQALTITKRRGNRGTNSRM